MNPYELKEETRNKIEEDIRRVKLLADLIELITNIIIEADEFGLEPTIPCKEDGKDITKRWSNKLKKLITSFGKEKLK